MNATINPTTDITTAARRIARDVNSNVAGVSRYYDADGRVLLSHPTELRFVRGEDAPAGWVLHLAGRHDGPWGYVPMTQREAQDLLDAAASGMDADLYLAELEWARR